MGNPAFKYFFDACAGIGCFHLGIVRSIPEAKFECLGMAELEYKLRKLYKQNFGSHIEDFGSVHLLSGTVAPDPDNLYTDENEELERWENLSIPKRTILTAGFPCQPFSKSGDQLGVNDRIRGTVFNSLLTMLKEKEFSGFILENVENLNGPNHKEDFSIMLKALKENYYVDYFIESPHKMDGDYALQHRQRVFILGLNKDHFNDPKVRFMSSQADRRTHAKKKEYAKIIFEMLDNPDALIEEYTSSGGTITIRSLQEIAGKIAMLPKKLIESKKKQELLKLLIEYRGGDYTDEMISTGSTITAKGWGKLVELYASSTPVVQNNDFGFFDRMCKLSDDNRTPLNDAHFNALEIWNEFLELLPIEQEPCSPVWSMEFGMTYDLSDLENGISLEEFERKNPEIVIPPYILSMFSEGELVTKLPKWKREFIEKNRDFYTKNELYLSQWLSKIRGNSEINNTLQKFEWQCEPSTWQDIVGTIKKTFKLLDWDIEGLTKESISSMQQFCNIIISNLKLEIGLGNDKLYKTLQELNFEIDNKNGELSSLFLTKSGKNFTIKGLRIINRILRKYGNEPPRTMIGNVVQFRPSGIRFSDSETSPALVAIGQIPYLVEKLEKDGVYKLSTRQAAYLQGIDLADDDFKAFRTVFDQEETELKTSEQFMRLGNAVNVELVRRIMYQFNEVAKIYCKIQN